MIVFWYLLEMDCKRLLLDISPSTPLVSYILHTCVDLSRNPPKTFVVSGPPEPPLQCNASVSKTQSISISCIPGFDGGLAQQFSLSLHSLPDNSLVINKTSLAPQFSLQGKSTYNYKNKTLQIIWCGSWDAIDWKDKLIIEMVLKLHCPLQLYTYSS